MAGLEEISSDLTYEESEVAQRKQEEEDIRHIRAKTSYPCHGIVILVYSCHHMLQCLCTSLLSELFWTECTVQVEMLSVEISAFFTLLSVGAPEPRAGIMCRNLHRLLSTLIIFWSKRRLNQRLKNQSGYR